MPQGADPRWAQRRTVLATESLRRALQGGRLRPLGAEATLGGAASLFSSLSTGLSST